MSPMRPLSPCSAPGCPSIAVKGGRCALHQRERNRQYDASRGTPAQRGYDAEWKRIRSKYLAKHPECAVCGGVATEVHHIEGIAAGHHESNLLPLCKPHHSEITSRLQGFAKGKR